jgi:heme o synthase
LLENKTTQLLTETAVGKPLSHDSVVSGVVNYIQLTKPRIMLLVLLTGACALVMEGSMLHQPLRFFLFLFGLYLTGGSANAFNQYFEREIDSRMSRTVRRRPLPQGALPPAGALIFAISIAVAGVLLLGLVFNWLTAALSMTTILFYSLVYTLVLKPSTYLNIVIGGAAGAMAPVGAWAAATGGTALTPWTIFLIVFLWTPPHFWSLALVYQHDYERVGLPMLPVVKGDDNTLKQILQYSVALVAISFTPLLFGSGLLYAIMAGVLGVLFIHKAVMARTKKTKTVIRGLFHFSIVYLLTLLAGLIVDKLITLV